MWCQWPDLHNTNTVELQNLNGMQSLLIQHGKALKTSTRAAAEAQLQTSLCIPAEKNESEIEDPIASNHARSVSTHVRWPLWTFTCQQPVITDYLCCCCKTNNQIIIDTDKQISWAFKHAGGDWAVNVIHRVAWETLVPACSHETDAGT